MKTLVTGAGGFCGSHLIALLRRQGHEVRSLGLGPAGSKHFHIDSTLDAAAMRQALNGFRPRLVFHLAGTIDTAAPEAMETVNAGFARTLLEALLDLGLADCRVVVFGSAAEYGPVPEEGLPITENTPADPRTAYAATKLRQTELALAAHAQGLPVTVLRPFNILGPGLSPQLALGRFTRQVADILRKRQEPVVRTGDLSGTRDFIDVADVTELALKLAGTPLAAGRIVNLCTGRETPVRAALEELLHLSGVAAQIQEALPPQGAGHTLRSVGSPRLLSELAGPLAFRPLAASLRTMLDHELGRDPLAR